MGPDVSLVRSSCFENWVGMKCSNPSPPLLVCGSVLAVVTDHRSFQLWSCHLLRIPGTVSLLLSLGDCSGQKYPLPPKVLMAHLGLLVLLDKSLSVCPLAISFFSLESCMVGPLLTPYFPLTYTQLFGVPSAQNVLSALIYPPTF